MKFLRKMKVPLTVALVLLFPVSTMAQFAPSYRVDTIGQLMNISINVGSQASAFLTGRAAAHDGGGGLWVFDGTSTQTTNTTTVVKPVGGNGRWIKASVHSLGPVDFYQPNVAVAGVENTYALSLYRGTPTSRTNHFGIGSDNNSAFMQSFAGKALHLQPGGNPVVIGPSGVQFQAVLSATATLDFASLAANTTEDLTITVPGAAVNDTVHLGPPATVLSGIVYHGYVSAANTVTVRAANVTAGPLDPASATFRATVIKY